MLSPTPLMEDTPTPLSEDTPPTEGLFSHPQVPYSELRVMCRSQQAAINAIPLHQRSTRWSHREEQYEVYDETHTVHVHTNVHEWEQLIDHISTFNSMWHILTLTLTLTLTKGYNEMHHCHYNRTWIQRHAMHLSMITMTQTLKTPPTQPCVTNMYQCRV